MSREILFRGKRADNGEWLESGSISQIYSDDGLMLADGDFWTLIAPETLGRYTGLTDKNGKKIFEGDIVKNIDGIYVVEYCKSLTRFALVHNGLMSGRPVSYGTIIGNIHDNPELMERKE